MTVRLDPPQPIGQPLLSRQHIRKEMDHGTAVPVLPDPCLGDHIRRPGQDRPGDRG